MDPFDTLDLRQLIREARFPAVSMYLPTGRDAAAQHNAPRFRNLLRRAEALLRWSALSPREARDRLWALRELAESPDLWRHQQGGLAVFQSGRLSRFIRLPYPVEELVVVSGAFHLKPLLPLLSEPQECYVLALGKDSARLFLATRRSAVEVLPPGFPRSAKEAFPAQEEFQKGIQRHRGPARGRPASGGLFHGHRTGKRDDERLLRYFRAVDRGLKPLLDREPAPLLLAAAEEHRALYRRANTCPRLLDEALPGGGSREGTSADELRGDAWRLLDARTAREQAAAFKGMEEAIAHGRAAVDPDAAVAAARDGRVDSCAVALDRHRWKGPALEGRGPARGGALASAVPDLLDVAAVETLFHGGKVYAVPAERMPGRTPIAAILRY